MGDSIFYIQIYGLAIMICIIDILSLTRRRAKKFTIEQQMFLMLIVSLLITLVLDLIGWCVDGKMFTGGKLVYNLSQALFYVSSGCIYFAWIGFIIYRLYRTKKSVNQRFPLNLVLIIIYVLLGVTSPLTELIFYIDEFNVYHRGPLFPIIIIYGMIYIGWGIVEVILFNRKFKGLYGIELYINLNLVPLIITLSTIIQSLFYGLSIIWPVCAVIITYLYSVMQTDEKTIDPLTNLRNRNDMEYYMKQRIKSHKGNRVIFFMYLDLHAFKKINDNLGHQVGDEALIDASKILKESCVSFGDVIFRIGGDEFGIVGERDSAEQVDKLRKIIKLNCELLNLNLSNYKIMFDMGISFYESGKSIDEWVRSADQNMYIDKNSKKLVE